MSVERTPEAARDFDRLSSERCLHRSQSWDGICCRLAGHPDTHCHVPPHQLHVRATW